jgi:cyclopropane-fatty-acyl-phospholipid synthase
MARLDEVRALGYPESFIRLWEFYLCYCEGGFRERQLGDVQMLLTRPRSRIAAPG